MQSYIEYVYGGNSRFFIKGKHFKELIYFDGTNQSDVYDLLRSIQVGKIDVISGGIRKNNAVMFRITNSSRYDMVYIEAGTWVGVNPRKIFLFKDEYIKSNFKVIDNTIIPVSKQGNIEAKV